MNSKVKFTRQQKFIKLYKISRCIILMLSFNDRNVWNFIKVLGIISSSVLAVKEWNFCCFTCHSVVKIFLNINYRCARSVLKFITFHRISISDYFFSRISTSDYIVYVFLLQIFIYVLLLQITSFTYFYYRLFFYVFLLQITFLLRIYTAEYIVLRISTTYSFTTYLQQVKN